MHLHVGEAYSIHWWGVCLSRYLAVLLRKVEEVPYLLECAVYYMQCLLHAL